MAKTPTSKVKVNTIPEQNDASTIRKVAGFFRFSLTSYLATVLVFTIPFGLFFYPTDFITGYQKATATVVYLLAVSFLYLLALVFERAVRYLFFQQRTIEGDIRQLYEQLETGDFFTTLIRINFKYIDKYYLQTQLQANKSYYLSAVAAVVSLLMIITGIITLFAGTESGNINASYVTMTAGVLGEFIATVFFFLYNRTVLEMSAYHQKLVLTQNISLALKIADGLKDEQAKSHAHKMLVECISKDINLYLTMQVTRGLRNSSE